MQNMLEVSGGNNCSRMPIRAVGVHIVITYYTNTAVLGPLRFDINITSL